MQETDHGTISSSRPLARPEHDYGGIVHIASGAVMGALLVALRLRYDNLVAPMLTPSVDNLVMGLLLPALLLT